MADVFVSYVREDRDIAEKLASGLTAAGFSVWWDRHIRGGLEFAKEIERELDAARAVIVLWSGDSLGSRWVRDEAEQAREEDKLIPVRLDGVQPPLGFRQTQALDFTGWKGDPDAATFTGLVDSVRHFIGGAASSSPRASTPSTKAWRGRFGRSRQRWVVASMVAVAVAAGAAALWFGGPQLDRRNPTPGSRGGIEIGTFEPLTKSDELERFAKGMTATLVRVLATSGIKTVAPGQADAVSGKADAEFAVHGRVDREGDNLVASADIVNRRDGVVLWSFTQKRDAAQFQVLQEGSSFAVAAMLRCGLRLRARASDPSTELLVLYLRFCGAGGDGQWEQTPELTRRIVETAPQDALSYGLQALANAIVSLIPTLGGDRKPTDRLDRRPPAEIARLRKVVYDSAKIAAEMDAQAAPYAAFARAIVVDPAVGIAQREQFLQQSIANGDDGAVNTYARLLESVGRIRDAHIAFERAVNENPFDQGSRPESAFLAAWLGNIEQARYQFDNMRGKVRDFDIDTQRVWTEMWLGDAAIAKSLYDQIKGQGAREWGGPDCMALFMGARAAAARPSQAEIERACGTDNDIVFAYFGYLDAAFRGIEEGYKPPDSIPGYTSLFMPHMQIVRADSRFMTQAARLGLVDYWLDTDQWPDFCTTEKLPYECKEAALAARVNRNASPEAPE